VQITACGTYGLRSLPTAPVPDEDLVALHVVRMLLAVTALVIGSRSVDLLQERISTLKVIGVLRAPALIGLALVLPATGGPTTGLLPVFEPWMGMKPATTERTPPPLQHKLLPDRGTAENSPQRSSKSEEKKRRRLKG
jgi:hypothetical protein